MKDASDRALNYARQYADAGFYLFPLRDRSKLPRLKNWQTLATRDRGTLEAWAKRYPGCGFGIFTGKFGDGQALLVIDVDSPDHGAGKKNGPATLQALTDSGHEFPPTLETLTPTGGRHLFYLVDAAVKQGVDTLGDGLDVRSSSGFVVAPGTTVEAGTYRTRDEERTPVRAPQWMIDACGAPRAKAANRQPLPGVDPERAERRVIEYLKTADRSVKGAGGDQCAYRVAAKCLSLGATKERALDLMLSEHWDHGCGWSADRLEEKVDHAWKYMNDPPGADAPEAVFEPIAPTESAHADEIGHPFDELNKQWAVVAEPPNTVVYRERVDGLTGQKVFERYTREAFFSLLATRQFERAPLAAKWWESPRRRSYIGGTEFAPGGKVAADVLNTWGGFAVTPAPGDWSLMREHIRGVICGGSQELDAYVLGWLARMVQRPGEPGQVALVLRGGRGVGKGTVGEMLCRIFGRHGMHIGNSQRLVGNFNGHLDGRVFLFADEAFYANDRKHEGILKALITERSLDVEAKYAAARNVRNTLHVMMASNDEWVVPAGAQERRFCVIDVADSRQQDIGYFGRIRQQMEDGGLAAMLHDLLELDLSGFDVWRVPHTKAGTEQRTASLRGADAWLFDALSAERVGHEEWTDAGAEVGKDDEYADYARRSRDLGDFKPDSREAFWRRVQKILRAGGFHLKELRKRVGGDQARIWLVPPLADARTAFERYLGGAPIEWAADG